MKKILVLPFFVLLVVYGFSQQWVARYNGTGNGLDEIKSMTVDNAGNVYVTGYSFTTVNDNDYVTIKYNASGAQQWFARYNGPGNGSDVPASVFVDRTGNVYVTGYSDKLTGGYINNDATTIKYNTQGIQQWVARYDGTLQRSDAGTAVKADAAGNVYITGSTTVHNGAYSKLDYLTVKYNVSGVQQWVATYNGPANQNDAAVGLELDAAGNIYVTGTSFAGADPIGENDYVTIKYNTSGVQQWVARYNGPASEPDYATGIAVDPAGNVYVTGYSQGSGLDYATVKYNTNGTQLWVARYDGPAHGSDIAYDIAIDNSGNVYVTGGDQTTLYNSDFRTLKYNAAGQLQWAARYNGPANDNDEAYAMTVDRMGNVYVTGYINGTSPGWDIATIKYSPAGVQQWVSRYDGPGHGTDGANAIGVDTLGNVYVAGGSTGTNSGLDFVTLKYNANGKYVAANQNTSAKMSETETSASALKITVFPNPCRAELNMKAEGLPEGEYRIVLTNLLGQVVIEQKKQWAIDDEQMQIDLSEVPAGYYIFSVSSEKIHHAIRIRKE